MNTRIINVSTTSNSKRLLRVPEIPTTLKNIISDYHFYRNKLVIDNSTFTYNAVVEAIDSCLGSENDFSVPNTAVPPGIKTRSGLSKNFVELGFAASGEYSGLKSKLEFFESEQKDITVITSFYHDNNTQSNNLLFSIIGDQDLSFFVKRSSQTGFQFVIGAKVINIEMSALAVGFHTVAIKLSNDTFKAFLDKTLLHTESYSGSYSIKRNDDLYVGSSVTGNTGYFGLICSLQILSNALVDNEIIGEMTRLENEMLA